MGPATGASATVVASTAGARGFPMPSLGSEAICVLKTATGETTVSKMSAGPQCPVARQKQHRARAAGGGNRALCSSSHSCPPNLSITASHCA